MLVEICTVAGILIPDVQIPVVDPQQRMVARDLRVREPDLTAWIASNSRGAIDCVISAVCILQEVVGVHVGSGPEKMIFRNWLADIVAQLWENFNRIENMTRPPPAYRPPPPNSD